MENLTLYVKGMNQGIGEFEKPLELHTQPGTEPVVRPPRRVPNALLDRLKEKLEKLEERRIIAKVEHPKSFQSDDTDDVWDDTVLNQAYDRAVKTANEEVAKRIAMETNSTHSGSGSKSNKGKGKSKKPKPKTVWKEGMPCRAIYEEDGLEYEAFILHIIDEEECVVQFLGYQNNERVQLSTLNRSHGDAARLRQLEAAARDACERDDDGFESQPPSSVDLYSDESSMQERVKRINIDIPRSDKSKKKKSNKKNPELDYGDLPALPMPNISMFKNMGGADMPFPPPPPLVTLAGRRSDAEEQAISDMLLSWYMSGYYTGLFKGLERQRLSRRYH